MKKILLGFISLLPVNLFAQSAVTYTLQTGNFTVNELTKNTNSNYFAGSYNNSSSEVAFYANGSGTGYTGDPGVASFQRFTTNGVGNGTARALQVGDEFKITCYVANSSSFFSSSSAGISFNGGTTSSSFSDYSTNQRAKFQINTNGNWFSAAAAAGTGYATPAADRTFTIKVTSANTINLIIDGSNGATSYDLVMAGSPAASGSNIESFAIWNQTSGSSNDMYWKNGELTASGTVEIGGNNGTSTISGIISDGLDANSTSAVKANSLTKLGTGTITLSGANSFTGTTTISAGKLIANSTTALGVGSDVTISSGATLEINESLTVGDLTPAAGATLTIASGKVLTVNGTLNVYEPISLDNSSIVVNNLNLGADVTLVADLTVNGDLTIQDGKKLLMGNYDMNLKGNLNRLGVGEIDATNMGVVSFTGTADQNLQGLVTFLDGCVVNITNGNLILADNGSVSGGITKGMKIAGSTLTLTSGNIDASANDTYVEVTDNSAISGGGDDSHIIGELRRGTNTTSEYKFPIGDGTTLKQVGLDPNGTAATQYSVELITPANTSSLGTGVNNVSTVDHWEISRPSGTTLPIVRLYWNSTSSGITSVGTDLFVAHYGSTWDKEASAATGTSASGSVETSAAVSSLSPFTFGSATVSINPLPVSLVDFKGNLNNLNQTQLTWKTASELNASHFNIHKSRNGIEKNRIGEVAASGTSSEIEKYSFMDFEPIQQKTFYFLEQVDFDGQVEWFGPATVSLEKESKIVSHYNATNSELVVSLNENLESEAVTVKVISLNGKTIVKKDLANTGSGNISIAMPSITSGIYIVQVITENNVFSEKVLF
ncbi:T9SS type A sorting domain-containing protein [Bacteroidia bacterium]|nr:T9SS type A sorting domain-containing protein [Bacteroidia bacterium]MDC1395767.1 T9SS type A sorting domain-containing protein [Bacteroidia bacterium]